MEITVLNKTVTQLFTNSVIAKAAYNTSGVFDLSDATDAIIGFSILSLEAGKTAKIEVFSDYTGANASYSVEAYGTPVITKTVYGNGSGTYTRGLISIPKSLRYCRLRITNNNTSLSITANSYLIKQSLAGLTKTGTAVLSNVSAGALAWTAESSIIDLSDAMSFAIGFRGSASDTDGASIEVFADPTGNDSSYSSNTSYHKPAEKAIFYPITAAYTTFSVIPMRIVADYVRLRIRNLDQYNTRSGLYLYSIIQTKTGT